MYVSIFIKFHLKNGNEYCLSTIYKILNSFDILYVIKNFK